MNVSVELMDPLQYHLALLIFLVTLLVFSIAAQIPGLARMLKKRRGKAKIDRGKVIKECLAELDEIAKIEDHRLAHQRISLSLRKAYGILNDVPTMEMTLREIRHENKALFKAISLCYEPEFAQYSNAEAGAALQKAREVCGSWH